MASSTDDKFLCVLCKKDERFEQSWVHHVSSIGHQRAISRFPEGGLGAWRQSQSAKERAVQVIGCQTLHASPLDIADYLTTSGGVIEEFICPVSITGTKPNVVLCLFKDGESVTRILEVKEPKIKRQTIEIQRKFACKEENEEEKCPNPKDQPQVQPTESVEATVESSEIVETQCQTPVSTKKKRKKKRKNLPPLDDQLKELFQSHKAETRTKIVKDIQKILQETFSNCVLSSYGTDAFGVCLPGDEIRLSADPYGKFSLKATGVISRNSADPMAAGFINQILSTHQHPDGSPSFKFVSQYSASSVADIPEISFKASYKEDLIPCKLQLENFLAVQKCRLLKFLTSHDVRVLYLFSLVKHWSKKHSVLDEIREGEAFEGCILITMMIFYLTQINLIPSVAKLRDLGKNNSLIVDNIDVTFCRNRTQVPSAKIFGMSDSVRYLTVLGILKSFFEFFGQFNFSENVLCTSTGTVLERTCFRPQMEDSLPPELLKHYRSNADGSLRTQKLDILSPVVIQDVFDLTDNIARSIDDSELTLLKSKCSETKEFLDDVIVDGKGDFNLFFNSKDVVDEEDAVYESSSDDEIIAFIGPDQIEPPPEPPSMDDILFPPSPTFSPSLDEDLKQNGSSKSPRIFIRSPDRSFKQESDNPSQQTGDYSPPVKRRRTPSPQSTPKGKWSNSDIKAPESPGSPPTYRPPSCHEAPVRIPRSPERMAKEKNNEKTFDKDYFFRKMDNYLSPRRNSFPDKRPMNKTFPERKLKGILRPPRPSPNEPPRLPSPNEQLISSSPNGQPRSPSSSPNRQPSRSSPNGQPRSSSPNGQPRSSSPNGQPRSSSPNIQPRSSSPNRLSSPFNIEFSQQRSNDTWLEAEQERSSSTSPYTTNINISHQRNNNNICRPPLPPLSPPPPPPPPPPLSPPLSPPPPPPPLLSQRVMSPFESKPFKNNQLGTIWDVVPPNNEDRFSINQAAGKKKNSSRSEETEDDFIIDSFDKQFSSRKNDFHQTPPTPIMSDQLPMNRILPEGILRPPRPPPDGQQIFRSPNGQARFPPPNGQARFPPPNEQARFPPPNGQARFPPPNGQARFEPPNGQARFPPPNGQARFEPPNGQPRFPPPNGQPRFPPPIGQPRFPPPNGQPRLSSPFNHGFSQHRSANRWLETEEYTPFSSPSNMNHNISHQRNNFYRPPRLPPRLLPRLPPRLPPRPPPLMGQRGPFAPRPFQNNQHSIWDVPPINQDRFTWQMNQTAATTNDFQRPQQIEMENDFIIDSFDRQFSSRKNDFHQSHQPTPLMATRRMRSDYMEHEDEQVFRIARDPFADY